MLYNCSNTDFVLLLTAYFAVITTWENHADTSVWMVKHIGRKGGTLNNEVKITALEFTVETPLFCNVKATYSIMTICGM